MTITMRHDRYVGPHHYWIRFYKGTCEVRKTETDNEFDPITTVFSGHYENCVKFINDAEIAYAESLF